MNFNIPGAAWYFLLILPLIIFYFLKLRRQRMEIPSLLLWQQVLEDSRVNSPFQKFKKNILLLIQLLILCLLILAAMDPFTIGSSSGLKLPVLVDCSASMGAVNKDGKTRMDIVKERLKELIENKREEQEIALIAFSNTARRVCSFTSNRQILLDSINKLKVDDVEGNFEDALRLTQAMTKSSQFGEVLLYTDGNIANVPTFDLSFKLNYQKIEEERLPNIGITKMSAVRSGESSWIVFIQLNMNEYFKGGAELQIFQNDERIGSDKIFSGEKLSQRLSFRIDGSKNSVIKAKLIPENEDSLEIDNQGYLSLKLARPLFVYVSDSLDLIKTIISNTSGVRLVPASSDLIDLAITDKKEDFAIEAKTMMTFKEIPEDIKPFLSTESKQSKIIDWDRTDLILQHTSLDDVLLTETVTFQNDSKPVDIEKKAYEILSYGEKAPVILKKNMGNKTVYHFFFHYNASTLPYKIAFPIMITNTVNKALADAGLSEKSGNKTGTFPETFLNPDTEYTIKSPNGKLEKIKSSERGLISGISTVDSGTYEILEGKENIQTIGISLLSPSETSLQKLNSVKFNEISVTVNEEEAQTDKSLWGMISLIAFLFLIIEWWYFQKKPGSLTKRSA
ncbi:MAG: BatA and WFA domain-containing protein [Lentisphaeraceae bacterium]|nr:BatA and WFA domain-containing protein [Lentisphaeraceae bacterium]